MIISLEFLAAAINKKLILSKNRLEAAFQMLDAVIPIKSLKIFWGLFRKKDGNGFLSLDELSSLFKNFDDQKSYFEMMFSDFDSNGDKQVVSWLCAD